MLNTVIKSGYCMIIQDFYAFVVPFSTVSVEFSVNTVPEYKVKLPNGELEQFNETDLLYSREELEKICKRKNEEMKNDRDWWLKHGLPTIRRLERTGV